jgi:hypothetical protein
MPKSEEYQAAEYTLKHLGSISAEQLSKEYRSSCPQNGKMVTLKDGQVVPALICNGGTVMHSLVFAYQVLKGKAHAGTSGLGATMGLGLQGPEATERARKQKEQEAFSRAANLHGQPPEKKKDYILGLVKKVRDDAGWWVKTRAWPRAINQSIRR